MVFIYKNNELCERMSLSEALSVNTSVISVVGAGGKTTLLHRLEDECVRKKQHVIITTTTKIMHENKPYFLEDTSIGKIKDTLGKFGRVWIGSRDLISGKTAPPAKEILDEIFWWELPILVEADGAKRLPLKVPAEHEPVIPSQTGHVVSVYGLDAIGRTVRINLFSVGKSSTDLRKRRRRVRYGKRYRDTWRHRHKAGRKGCPPYAQYTVVLNKADSASKREAALEVCRELNVRGVENIVVTSLHSKKL